MKYFSFAIIVVACYSCFSTRPSTTSVATERLPATFDFSPPNQAKPGATNMTIALLKPAFVGKDHPEYYTPPFDQMASSMSADFEELLTSKGFTVRGPFRTRDEMTFSEQTTSDFALEVNIILLPVWEIKYNENVALGSILSSSLSYTYTSNGTATFGGYLEVNARSPQYGKLIWKKKIDLAQSRCTFFGKKQWQTRPSITDQLKEDNEVYNTVSRELEKVYAQAMDLVWRQIDPVEMKTIAEQSKKADAKQ